ncbi:MAG: cupin fold metalloprotein, WbuC family [Terriglobia bacterium]|nr:MAG: cupin fold metalloprotein, WbuC family [Terriglobia bacterium]
MPVQLITRSLFDETARRAAQSHRRRMNHNFHAAPTDNPHRFLNVLLEKTYIRPHRHLEPPKSETFLVLEGEVAFFQFDDNGTVAASYSLGPDQEALGIDVPPGVWHTLTAVSPHAICFEVKPGPWEPATDKEFAPWAPDEGNPEAGVWLQGLLESFAR